MALSRRASRLLWTVLLIPSILAGCGVAPRPLVAPVPAGASLAVALDSIFADTALQNAHLGILIRSLRSGETLYARDPGKSFVPASNMKVLTGAAALEVLGPEYRYGTSFTAAGPISGGVLRGDLVVRGTGDPTLSKRFSADARHAMRAWADSLSARGITRISGGIIGVDSAFAGPSLGPGWAWDDLHASYSAEFGALQFNEGVVEVRTVPGRTAGGPAVTMLDPPTQYVPLHNQVITGRAGTLIRVRVTRDPVGAGLSVHGEVPADTPLVVETVAVRDPTGYFLAVLRETLRDSGVAVEGQALAAHEWPEVRRPAAETPLFAYRSPPLREILPAMMKPSQNWIAETLLWTLGRERRGEGSTRAGAAVVDSVLRLWRVPTRGLRMLDGSGLSRGDLLTPELLVELLTYMSRTPNRELWYSSLPAAGQSGTLAGRMRDAPLHGQVFAKTGSLTGVRSLSGYLSTVSGEPIVFSIISNNHLSPAATIDRVVERALREVATRH